MELNLFTQFVQSRRGQLEEALHTRLPVSALAGTERFNEALNYAVFPGGKRLRPHLTAIASLLAGASEEQAVNLACAIECELKQIERAGKINAFLATHIGRHITNKHIHFFAAQRCY